MVSQSVQIAQLWSRCMLIGSKLPDSVWAEAVNTAVYLRNRSPSRTLQGETPFFVWYGTKPSVAHLKIFGSKAIMFNKRPGISKFHAKGIECVMVGYATESKAYRLFDKKCGKVYTSRDVKFVEIPCNDLMITDCEIPGNNFTNTDCDYLLFPQSPPAKKVINVEEKVDAEKFIEIPYCDYQSPQSSPAEKVKEVDAESVFEDALGPDDNGNVVGSDVSGQEEADDVNEDGDANKNGDDDNSGKVEVGNIIHASPRVLRSGKIRSTDTDRPLNPTSHSLNYVNAVEESNPRTVREAFQREDAQKWKQAMEEEFNSLKQNNTWELVDLRKNRHAIKTMWVFNLKRNKEGCVERYKARLVAKGCGQEYGVDFSETFSPVARYSTIRLVVALAVEFDLLLHNLDVTSAYLNGELDEVIFMEQPECFVDNTNPNKVCRLRKALYGLKQSGRQWNLKLDGALKNIGFVRCVNDSCVYTKNKNGRINIIVVYVDDIILACKEKSDMDVIKRQIESEFEIVDKGPLNYFLGMEFERSGDRGSIKMSQLQLIKGILQDFQMNECRKVNTPLDPGTKLKICDRCPNCSKVDKTLYQSLMGSLNFISITTRPDISHTVIKLSQYNMNPHKEHFIAAKHLLRYLYTTMNYKIVYRKSGMDLHGYTDADWGGNSDDRRSFTGHVFFLAGSPVSWESKKQPTVALSSTEAEYMALCSASKEIVFLRNLVKEIGFSSLVTKPTVLYGDNLSAQQLVKNPVFHARSKHIDIKMHFVRDVYERKELKLEYISTDDMVADVLTKNLKKLKHVKFVKMLNLM